MICRDDDLNMCLMTRTRTLSAGSCYAWDRQLSIGSVASTPFAPRLDPDKLDGRGLACNMVLSVLGTSLLGVPAQMKRAGWILGPSLIALGCVIVAETTVLVSSTVDVLRRKYDAEVVAYQDFVEGALGKRARIASTVTSALALLGMICNGFVLESRNLQFAAPIHWPWMGSTEQSGKNWWALILSSTSILYCFVDAGSLLKRAAAFGPLVCVLCVVLALVGTGSAILDSRDFPESCRGGSTTSFWSLWPELAEGDVHSGLWNALLEIVGVASYAFYCFAVVITVPSMKHQMQKPSELVPAALAAYAACTAVFLVIMVTGYLGFGNLMPDNLIDGMRRDRPLGWWATTRPWETGSGTFAGQSFAWMIIVNLLLTDAIYVPCTVISLENAAPEFFRRGHLRRVSLRVLVILTRLLVATYVNSFIALTNLTSALFCVLTNILFPIIAFHRMKVRKVGAARRTAHALMFLFGCVVMVFGSYGAVSAIVSPTDSTSQLPGLFPRSHITDACREAYLSLA